MTHCQTPPRCQNAHLNQSPIRSLFLVPVFGPFLPLFGDAEKVPHLAGGGGVRKSTLFGARFCAEFASDFMMLSHRKSLRIIVRKNAPPPLGMIQYPAKRSKNRSMLIEFEVQRNLCRDVPSRTLPSADDTMHVSFRLHPPRPHALSRVLSFRESHCVLRGESALLAARRSSSVPRAFCPAKTPRHYSVRLRKRIPRSARNAFYTSKSLPESAQNAGSSLAGRVCSRSTRERLFEVAISLPAYAHSS